MLMFNPYRVVEREGEVSLPRVSPAVIVVEALQASAGIDRLG